MYGRYKNSVLVRSLLAIAFLSFVTLLVSGGKTSADILKSPDYQLQPTVGNSFGGSVGSSSYHLTDSGGEAVIGNGAGGSYKLNAGFVAELQHSINLYVEPDGLVGYWPMSEGTGPTVHDASGNSDDGTIHGDLSWTGGKIGNGLHGNAVSGAYVALPTSGPYASVGTNNFTLSSWIKTTATRQEVIFSTAGSGQGFRFGYVGGRPYYLVGGGGSENEGSIGTTSLNDGKWHYLAITYTYSGTWVVTAYIDGVETGSVTTSATGAASYGTQPMIGAMTADYWNVDGTFDDVKFFNRALSSDEVKANYEAESHGFDSGLVIPPSDSGDSETVDADVIVVSDTTYSLLTRNITPLTLVGDSSVTIPPIDASISSPQSWNDSTTTGFGFTILSAPGGVPSKWGGGSKYAGVPMDDTSFFTKSGLSGGAKDVIKLQYRLGVSGAQPSGRYKNNIVYTATMTP